MKTTALQRRDFLRWLGLASSSALALSPTWHSSARAQSSRALRIGYQKSATLLNLLKTRDILTTALPDVSVEWLEFQAGPQILEGLNVGSVDFAYVGEAPPVFAQAAGAPLVYVAYDPLGGKAEALLVQKDSPIQSVSDLKGKTVTLNRGSNVHYLLVKALEEAGLEYSDITTAFLPPSDARPAFEGNQVDAWVIWDPFQAAAEQGVGARILRDGEGIVSNFGYYLTTRNYIDTQADVVEDLLAELVKIDEWASNHRDDVAQFLSDELSIDVEALKLAESRRNYGVLPLTDEVVAGQQDLADTFFDLELIPTSIDISSAVWTWQS